MNNPFPTEWDITPKQLNQKFPLKRFFFNIFSNLLTAEWSLAPGVVNSELNNLRKMTCIVKKIKMFFRT